MNTRNTLNSEDHIFDSISTRMEQVVEHHKKVDLLYDVYDSYPEKQSGENLHQRKFENIPNLPLGNEYRLHKPIEHHNHSKYRDLEAIAALNEEINNLDVKFGPPKE